MPTEPPMWSQNVVSAVLNGFEAFVSKVLLPFTATDALTRRVGEHVEWDPVLTHAFTFFDAVHPSLFLFFNRIVQIEDKDRLRKTFEKIRPALLKSLKAINAYDFKTVKVELNATSDSPPTKQRKADSDKMEENESETLSFNVVCSQHSVTTHSVSLHNPIPRVIYDLMGGAALLGLEPWKLLCGEKDEKVDYCDLKPEVLMEPAIRSIVYQSQVQASMWRRNGMAVAQQILFYRHHLESCHQFDLDLLGVQISGAAPETSTDDFLLRIVDKFGLTQWLENRTDLTKNENMSRYGASLVDEMLLLLVNIFMERYRPGVAEGIDRKDCLRYRLIQKLAMGSLSHSQLREWLLSHNDDYDAESDLESLLEELAETRSRATDGRVIFDLKQTLLKEFNPFASCLDRNDLGKAEQHVREELGRLASRESGSYPTLIVPVNIPPFTKFFKQLTNILHSPIFAEIIRIVMSKWLKQDKTLHQDCHIDKILFLLSIIAVEDKRKNGTKFSDLPHANVILTSLMDMKRTSETGDGSGTQGCTLSKSQSEMANWLVEQLVPVQMIQPSTPAMACGGGDQEEQDSDAASSFKQKSDLAKLHRNKLMAKMAKLQRNFLETHPELGDIGQQSGAGDGDQSTCSPMDTSQSYVNSILSQMFDSMREAVCMVCQDSCKPSVVSKQTGSTASHQHIVIPGGAAPDAVASANPVPCMVACMQRSYAVASSSGSLSPSVYVAVCGHPIHSYCWQRYTESQNAQPRHRFMPAILQSLFGNGRHQQSSTSIAPCPLCESLGNLVVPVVDVRSFLPPTSPSVPSSSLSVLADCCKLSVTEVEDPDDREYMIVSNHRVTFIFHRFPTLSYFFRDRQVRL